MINLVDRLWVAWIITSSLDIWLNLCDQANLSLVSRNSWLEWSVLLTYFGLSVVFIWPVMSIILATIWNLSGLWFSRILVTMWNLLACNVKIVWLDSFTLIKFSFGMWLILIYWLILISLMSCLRTRLMMPWFSRMFSCDRLQQFKFPWQCD